MSSRLRKCQTDAIVTYYTRRKNGERQTDLSLCTGAGKTLIIQEISQSERRVIIVFPWLTLLEQFWNDKNNPFKKHKCVRYFATEGTLKEVKRVDTKMDELDASDYVILTTYTSAPEVYSRLLTKGCSVDLLIHDEAHRAKRHLYSESLATIEDRIGHCVNLSATLPVPADYKYSLLRGIKDKVVRDFNMEIFLCTDIEREESKLFVEIVKQLQNNHPSLKLLVYTAEANTDGDNSSSVKTYLEQNQAAAKKKGWWMRGLYEETMSDRTRILNEFQKERLVSILVSCRTISEGVDLKNANCMMPWDASKSPIDNIQRIGRILRLYKDNQDNLCPEHLQLPSTVAIPVFLTRSKFEMCGGDKQRIHDVLNKEIELNINGDFMPFITVCAALKDELADQDEDLFNQLMNMPPKMKHTRNAVECLAKYLRKSADELIDQLCVCGGGGDFVETIRTNEWDDEETGNMLDLLAMSQGLTLVVDDGENITRHGDGEVCVELKKNDNDDGYKVVNGNKAKREKKALKRVSNRTKVKFSSDFTILLGLDDVDEDLITQEKNFIATKMSASVIPREKKLSIDKLAEVKAWMDENERCPSQGATDRIENKLAGWLRYFIRLYAYNIQLMENQNMRQPWEEFIGDPKYSKYLLSKEEMWINILAEVKAWMDENERRPSMSKTADKIEEFYATWISTQKKNYCNSNFPRAVVNKESLGQLWKEFNEDPVYRELLNPGKKQWIDMLTKIKANIHKNGFPIAKDKLGYHAWLYRQKCNYSQTNHCIMNDPEIRQLWEDFVKDPMYSEHFLSNEEKWIRNEEKWIRDIEEIITEIDKYKRIPTNRAWWIRLQKADYVNNEKMLSYDHKHLRQYWENINDDPKYSEYFFNDKERWFYMLAKCKAYIDERGIAPKQTEGPLGKWISRNRDKRKWAGWDVNRRESMEKFLEDYSIQLCRVRGPWINTLSEVKECIKKHDSLPSKGKYQKLYKWVQGQKRNYKDRLGAMGNKYEDLRQLWEKFEEEYNMVKSSLKASVPKQTEEFEEEPNHNACVQEQAERKTKKSPAAPKSNLVREISKKKTESIIPSPPPTQNTIVKRTPKRKLKIQSEKTYRNCSRVKSSKLTEFHCRFKRMKSTNYNAMNVSREDFDAYHLEADKYDARDAEDIQACANVERLLLEWKPKCNRKTYHAIDLGCGMNRFRHRKAVQKMTWESLDIYAVDDTVTVGNIGDMKELYEEEEFDVVIANRALWGIDYVVMLSEIQRIVKTGGVVVFCEAVGRWIKKSEDKKTNILPLEIERCGLKLVKQEGIDICEDGTHDLWQYIVATK